MAKVIAKKPTAATATKAEKAAAAAAASEEATAAAEAAKTSEAAAQEAAAEAAKAAEVATAAEVPAKNEPIKRLALVIHGLGEQGPGETLDDLAGGLWGDKDELCVESDVRLMQEVDQFNHRKLSTFPCHVRRYSDPTRLEDGPHTTFAEVYWADLSQADHGALRIFYGLIKTILGLGHIVRASAKEYFGEKTWRDKANNWIANFVPYLMHGPVAAVNGALAAGILVLYAATRLFAETGKPLGGIGINRAVLAAGVAIALIGFITKSKSEVYYFRIFLVWLGILGVILAVLANIELVLLYFPAFADSGFFREYGESKAAAVNLLLDDKVVKDAASFTTGIEWHGVVLLLGLKAAWAAAMGAILLSGVTTLTSLKKIGGKAETCQTSDGVKPAGKDEDGASQLTEGNEVAADLPEQSDVASSPKEEKELKEEKTRYLTPLHLVLMCAMSWLWMFVVATIWVTVNKLKIFDGIMRQELLEVGVAQLLIALIGFGIVSICVVFTVLRRFSYKSRFRDLEKNRNRFEKPEETSTRLEIVKQRFAKEEIPRLLLSGPLKFGILLTGAIFVGSAIVVLLQNVNVEFAKQLAVASEDWVYIAIAVSAAIGGFAYSQREDIAQGLGVAKDLITYFKVEPTEPGKSFANSKKMGVFSFPWNFDFETHLQRARIQGRMQKVLQAMAKSYENFKDVELIVISHSQGTIIATDFAKELHKNSGSLISEEARKDLIPILKKATLITMGSPFTHVYNHYLPTEFKSPVSIKGPESVGIDGFTDEAKMISKWVNIFRVDDFIGTYIGNADLSGPWPENKAVPPGGHTGYWTDGDVIHHLRDYFDQPSTSTVNAESS